MAKFFEVRSGAISVKFYPLNLKQVQEREDELEDVISRKDGEKTISKERFARLVKWFTLSAQRGDPTITEDQVAQVVDLENLTNVTRAIMGMFNAISQEDKDAAATPTLPQIGAVSTQG